MSAATPGHTVIRASAGAGKTWRLGNRYIGLLAAGVAPENIVAATFSRKAAGEILERILTRLARASLSPEAGARLAVELGQPGLSAESAGELLRSLARSLHRLRVCTLDSLFGDVARGFGPELGLPPGWEMAEDDDTHRLQVEAIDAALRAYDVDALIKLLNDLDEGAAEQSVIKGFDEVIRTFHGVACESEAAAWGAVTVEGRLDAAAIDAAAAALGADPVTNGHVTKARDKVLGALARGEWATVGADKLLASQAAGEPYQRTRVGAPAQAACARIVGHALAEVVAAMGRRTASARQMLDLFEGPYREVQRRRRLLRFEDVARAIGEGALDARMEEVFQRLDARTEHLLLDEFQDTSPAQWRVLLPFARVAVREGSLFVVGDVKQAIYGWRGGVAEIFDAVTTALPGLGEETLEKSQRSAPVVIDAVNRVFAAIATAGALGPYAEAGGRWAKGFIAHTTARDGLRGHVSLRTAPEAAEGEKQSDATLACAADHIRDLAAAHPGCSLGVLVRTNDSVRALTDLLRARDVPVSGEGTSTLTGSRAVDAVLSLLRFVDHPGHTIARYHVACSPLGAVVGFVNHEDRHAARRLSIELRAALMSEGYGACLYEWARGLASSCDARDLRRLLKLVELGYEYDRDATLRPTDFVAWVEKKRVPDAGSADVRVMNVHQSKGLQFDLVVLPELDGSFPKAPRVLIRRDSPLAPITAVSLPGRKGQLDGTPLQALRHANECESVVESINLLYVALTRAVHAVHIVVAPEPAKASRGPTMAKIVCEALCPGAERTPAALLFELGERDWFATTAPPVMGSAAAAEPVRVVLRRSSRSRGLERQSPSSHEGGGRSLSAALAQPNRGALEQGTLIHAFFERVRWIEDGLPEGAALLRLARASGLSAEESTRRVEWFERMMADPVVRGALSLAGQAAEAGVELEVRREFPFAQREGDALVNGVIDRLVLHRRGGRTVAAEVIDFKTDGVSAGEAEVAARVEVHRGQMEAYRRAVARMERVPPERVRARLLFVTAGVVRDV